MLELPEVRIYDYAPGNEGFDTLVYCTEHSGYVRKPLIESDECPYCADPALMAKYANWHASVPKHLKNK